MPQRLPLRPQADLVSASDTLREAILASGAGATTPAHAWRLGQEGLLAWGLCAGAARDALCPRDGARDVAADGPGVPSGQAPAAVVRLMATLTLQSMPPLEVT
jgi:hypothetical protein